MYVVRGYMHHDGAVGVLVRFSVGSDFTTRTEEFKSFADHVAMSIAFHLHGHCGLTTGTVEDSRMHLSMESPYDEVMWLGEDDFETVCDAIEGAEKQFQEPVTIESFTHLVA